MGLDIAFWILSTNFNHKASHSGNILSFKYSIYSLSKCIFWNHALSFVFSWLYLLQLKVHQYLVSLKFIALLEDNSNILNIYSVKHIERWMNRSYRHCPVHSPFIWWLGGDQDGCQSVNRLSGQTFSSSQISHCGAGSSSWTAIALTWFHSAWSCTVLLSAHNLCFAFGDHLSEYCQGGEDLSPR